MFFLRLTVILILFSFGIKSANSSEHSVLKMFGSHCVKCHGEGGKEKGEVNLLEIKTSATLSKNIDLLQDLIDVINNGDMPPEGESELKPIDRKRVVSELRGILNDVVAKGGLIPKTPIRRMNRFQYNNAVKDLFELNVEVFSLPEKMMRRWILTSTKFQHASIQREELITGLSLV